MGLEWQDYVVIDEKYFRPAEVDLLIGDASKAFERFGWKPKVTFKELVKLMVDADIELLHQQLSGKIILEQEV